MEEIKVGTAGAPTIDAYDSVSVLVTGGASFIGSHLVELLVRSGARVRVVDDLSTGKVENLSAVADDVEIIVGDLRSTELARRSVSGEEVVFHLAAMHGGRGYIDSHPVECLNNMTLDHTVFSKAAEAGVRKIVHASSACVYPTVLQGDDQTRLLLQEDDCNFDEQGKTFPDGEYGWAKLMGELQLRAFHKQFGLDGIACRLFTAYGEREKESHAVIALIAKALARLDPYPIWGDGKQTRNFTYIRDTVQGLALAGALLSGFDTINVGTSTHTTINEVVDIILEKLDWQPERFDYQLDKPVGVKSRAADCSKSLARLGWQPETTVSEGLARTISWYVEHTPADQIRRIETLLMSR
jgi:nucleoside-diphosphate-sugar epimerase